MIKDLRVLLLDCVNVIIIWLTLLAINNHVVTFLGNDWISAERAAFLVGAITYGTLLIYLEITDIPTIVLDVRGNTKLWKLRVQLPSGFRSLEKFEKTQEIDRLVDTGLIFNPKADLYTHATVVTRLFVHIADFLTKAQKTLQLTTVQNGVRHEHNFKILVTPKHQSALRLDGVDVR